MLSTSLITVGSVSTLELVDMNLPPNKSSKTIVKPSSEIANLNNATKKVNSLESQPRPSSSCTSSPCPPTHNHGSPTTTVSGTKQRQCYSSGGNDAESSETPDQPSEAIATNANATVDADDHCNEQHKSSDTMDQGIYCKRRKLNATPAAAAPDISLRKLIPPKDCPNIRRILKTAGMQQQLDVANDDATQHNESHMDQGSTLQRPTFQFDWSAVIARARSHPQEATEPYFGPVDESCTTIHANNAQKSAAASSSIPMKNNILTYKPLHAMLKYDPPLDAVEAILRAHPEAALDVTFEGSALKIAAESGVSSMLVLRLLLVAEMAMRKRLLQQQQQLVHQQQDVSAQTKSADDPSLNQLEGKSGEAGHEAQGHETLQVLQRQQDISAQTKSALDPSLNQLENKSGEAEHKAQKQPDTTSHAKSSSTANPGVVHPLLAPQSNMFSASHNPIRWITERRIPVKTAAMLLKWYPMGAFQRPSDEYGVPIVDETDIAEAGFSLYDLEALESPLIEIVDDFARDHYDESAGGDEGNNDEEVYTNFDSETDYDHVQEPNSSPEQQQQQTLSSSSQTYQQREYLRKEQRWEKFLHILYATDLALQSTRRRPRPLSMTEESNDHTAMSVVASVSRDDSNVSTESQTASSSSAAADAASSSKINDSTPANPINAASSPPPPSSINSIITPFRPVHAWIRCLTSPHLGLEHCRPYGVWSVLRVMGQRIPSEFTVRDTSDGNRTAFQTLAESSARDCRLCLEEVKDVVECLMDADYRSAFLPRNSDGRLIGHVALENGWPCKDLFSRKTSATCA